MNSKLLKSKFNPNLMPSGYKPTSHSAENEIKIMIAKQFLSLYDFNVSFLYVSFLLCICLQNLHKNKILLRNLCKTPHMVIYSERVGTVGNYSSNSISSQENANFLFK